MKSYLRAFALLLLAAASLAGCGSPPEPPPSTPISLGPTRTPGPDDAPPVAQIQSEVARLRAEDASTSDSETRARNYLKSLEGKRVVDWHAWAYQNIASPDGTVLRLRAVYSDPYKEGATESFPFKRYGGGAVYFDLDGLTRKQLTQFLPGDELRLSGTIMDAYSIPRITVEEIQKVP